MAKDALLRRTIFVFQGGGALGSYQVGAFQALDEFGYAPDMIVGISIGAINAAIIAGNQPHNRLVRLREFWNTITTSISLPPLIDFYGLGKVHNWLGAQNALMHGQPGFYTPKLTNPASLSGVTPDKISYYDTSPLRDTLAKLIDFEYLNQKHIRLALGAVEVSSGDFIFFDSYEQEITLEHIMASAALPGFPAVEIAGKYYIDGGVFSNTPLIKAINEFAATQHDKSDRLCFIVDLFSAAGNNPQNLDEMLERIKDIQYSSHSRGNPFYSIAVKLTQSIEFLNQYITEEGRQNPQVQAILNTAYVHKVDVVQLVYKSANKHALHSKDYNFSKDTSKLHCAAGYQQTRELIEKYQQQWQQRTNRGLVLYSQKGVDYH